jgi:N-acyl-D-amino-acid deacylase
MLIEKTIMFQEQKMKGPRVIWFLICLFLMGCQQPDQIPTTGDFQAGMGWFDRAMIGLMEKWEIPGGALAVMQDGEILLARGYGYADVESGEWVQPDSIFRIASVSKPFTAVAVLQLVEGGSLSLDTPVFQLLDDLQPPDGMAVDPRIYEITIRHLLEHAGGWDLNVSYDPMFMSSDIGRAMGTTEPADCTTIIRYMLEQPLDFDPGSQYAYSNFGYCILGRVIEKVSGMTYAEYVKTHILDLIGNEDMRLGHSLLSDRYTNEVHYYGTESSLTQSVFPEETELTTWPYGGFYLEAMDSHGGWVASATDLVRFASALAPESSTELLKPNMVDVMIARPEIPLWQGTSNYYAFGWFVRPSGSGASQWHTGSLSGTTALLFRTSSGLIWAALFNSRPEPPDDQFAIDIITQMGKAAVMNMVVWGSVFILTLLVGVFTLFIFRRRRKKPSG